MKCEKCGAELTEGKLFCPQCGHLQDKTLADADVSKQSHEIKIPYKWYRVNERSWIDGIFSGVAHKWGWNAVVLRIVFLLGLLFASNLVNGIISSFLFGGFYDAEMATTISGNIIKMQFTVFGLLFITVWLFYIFYFAKKWPLIELTKINADKTTDE